jgi:hypothetical protein
VGWAEVGRHIILCQHLRTHKRRVTPALWDYALTKREL